MTEYKKVMVTWEDAHTSGGWHIVSDVTDELTTVYTLGWLIQQTERAVVVAGGLSENYVLDLHHIPQVLVREIRYIELGEIHVR